MRASRFGTSLLFAFGVLIAQYATWGQTPGIRHVGVIYHGGMYDIFLEALRTGLREQGLEEGKQFVLDIRDTKGDLAAVEGLAMELERNKVDVLYTVNTSITLAAKRATTHTPIVFFAGTDPVEAGLVDSIAKPGGRLTGVHGLATDLTGKRLEVLKEMIPKLRRVVTFYNPGNPVAREAARLGRDAGQRLGVQFVERHVGSVEDLRQGLQALKPGEADAFFQVSDGTVTSWAQLIIDIAKTKRLPTMFYEQGLVAKGGLASYGQDYSEIGRMSAKFVHRVLTGTHPKDLPVENFDRLQFAINLRTAREIGLTIPRTIRALADKVIDS